MSALLVAIDGCVGASIVVQGAAGTHSPSSQAYDLLLALRVADNLQRLYLLAQEEGLVNLVREHVPSVLATRFPENQLIAKALAGARKEGGAA